ncbi:MAG: hypothetical protein MRY74_05795 [Neomegalonema sp.]|nr:hypothetical protein [Neomegalonema sp.]
MCELSLILSAASTGLGLMQQQAQANAANARQRQLAAIQRRETIARYDQEQRSYSRKRVQASEAKAENALKALAQRERARTQAGAQGKSGASRSVKQLVNSVTAVEGRENARLDGVLQDASIDARVAMEAAERAGQRAALSNLSSSGPNVARALVGFASSNYGAINRALSSQTKAPSSAVASVKSSAS